MKRMRRIIAAIALTMAMLCISGCMKAVALDEYAYVIAIGIDKGIIKPYKISFLLQKEGGGEDGQENAGAKLMSAEGNTLSDAMQSLQTGYPNALNLSRVTVLAISDELARDGVMEKLLSIAFNSYHMRRSVKLMTVQKSAYDYFNGLSMETEPNVTKLQVAMMNARYENGASPLMNIALFTEAVHGKRSDVVMPLGIAEKKDDESQKSSKPQEDEKLTAKGITGAMSSCISGIAVYDGIKMVGTISQEDTCFVLLGRGELEECSIDVTVDGEMVSLRLLVVEYKAQARLNDDKPSVNIDAKLNCELLSCPEKVISADKISFAAQTKLKDGLKRVFQAGVRMNSDVLGLGRYVSRCFTDVEEWESYKWKQKLAECAVDYAIEVDVNDKSLIWEVSG